MSVLKKSTALFLSIVIVICSMLMNIGTVLAAERNESSSVLDNDEINDFSVPELNVTVDDENKWTNDINKLKITAPVSTEIYYKTSTDKLDDWGNYTDSDAFVWDGDESENLPQGSYYIKFWAKYPGESNPVNDSVEAVHFMYDTEGPSAFKIKETKIGNDYCLVADEDITDLSGVQDIHYFIDNNSEGVYVEKIKLDGDKKVNFKIPLNSEMQSHSIKIELSDNLGNKTTVSSGKIEDADIPKINGFQVVNISDKKSDTNDISGRTERSCAILKSNSNGNKDLLNGNVGCFTLKISYTVDKISQLNSSKLSEDWFLFNGEGKDLIYFFDDNELYEIDGYVSYADLWNVYLNQYDENTKLNYISKPIRNLKSNIYTGNDEI